MDSSKLKEFADNNFKLDGNGSKLSKLVENTVGKGEIARYERFLLFPQCFQKAHFQGASKGVIVWEWVNPKGEDFEKNIMAKGENADKRHFSPLSHNCLQFGKVHHCLVW